MKKLICLLLALSMLFTFCSCSGLVKNKADAEDPDPVMDEDPPATEGTEAPTEIVYEISEADTDGDGLYDHAEVVYQTDVNNADTDADGLNDYQELKQLGTDPLVSDSNKNGVNDFDDDHDADGLSNGYELENGLNPNAADSDFDGLLDGEELQTYQSDPLHADTDGDGASDGWEAEREFDPVAANEAFTVCVSAEKSGFTAGVTASVSGQTAESMTVTPARSSVLVNDTIPGILGPAYSFEAVGDLGAVEIFFTPSSTVLSNENIDPVIYCLNEQTQVLYEMETTVENGTAKTVTSHFSTYLLLDRNVYEEYLSTTYNVDYAEDSGVDSNNDGISDYVTKLMCDGIIRTGTGTMIFGDYTYEEVQAGNDIDHDGIINGDEVECDYYVDIPEGAVEFNGHYYKVFDVGDFWLSARAYCESVGGYLCTVTSQEEQNFIVSLLGTGSKNVYWLGGARGGEGWAWITHEDFSYTSWGPDEPNNMEGAENYLQIYAKAYRQKVAGDWNDASNVGAEYASDFYSVLNTGYICEWGSFTVNSQTYAFINSSPIHTDTDNDGFEDAVDPTPSVPSYFRDLEHYIQYKYNDTPSATFLVDQPVYGSNIAIGTGNDVGHSFILLHDGNGNFEYIGFYPAGWEGSKYTGYIDYTISNIYTRGFDSTAGTTIDDTRHGWDVAYSKALTQQELEAINEYVDTNRNHDYNLQSYNCTTFAVNALEAGDFKITDYVSKSLWALPMGYAALTLTIFYPYGYSPGNAGYELMIHTPEFIGHEEIQLQDGTTATGVSDFVLQSD